MQRNFYGNESCKMQAYCNHTSFFRHAFTTRMVEKGIHPKVLQYLLGHADISMTMDVHAHMDSVVAVEKTRDALCE